MISSVTRSSVGCVPIRDSGIKQENIKQGCCCHELKRAWLEGVSASRSGSPKNFMQLNILLNSGSVSKLQTAFTT